MTIIEEVRSPVVVVMVVIDIDGSMSSSRCDLQYQWWRKYTIAKDLTIHRQGTCSIRFNGTIHRTGNYYCFIQLVDSLSVKLVMGCTRFPFYRITSKQASMLTTGDMLFRMEFITKTYSYLNQLHSCESLSYFTKKITSHSLCGVSYWWRHFHSNTSVVSLRHMLYHRNSIHH